MWAAMEVKTLIKKVKMLYLVLLFVSVLTSEYIIMSCHLRSVRIQKHDKIKRQNKHNKVKLSS